jgi:signal transduction histidine kinase
VTALVAPPTWVAQVHLVIEAVFALATGPVVFALVAVTLFSLPILPVSVLAFGLLLVVSRLVGRFERARLAAVPGLVLGDPHHRHPGSRWAQMIARMRSAATWKEIGYHLLHPPTALLFAALSIGTWATALTLIALPWWVGQVPAERARLGPVTVHPGGAAWAVAVLGLALLLVAPWLVRGLSRLAVGMATGLLARGESDALRARVDTLEVSRARVTDAAGLERQRIERNLHDGAQQRLVALAMALGMAQEKFDEDPGAARALVDEAHLEAKRALVELRDLARGLHPPVLTDRGLGAAVAGLASRAPIPVDVDVQLARRPTPTVEGIAYFVIAECLANTAHHSGATRSYVRLVDAGDRLVVEVGDDGGGGADPARGSGLRGLTDRVAAVDGTFWVMSPPGGPTTVRAELPLPFGEQHAHRDR